MPCQQLANPVRKLMVYWKYDLDLDAAEIARLACCSVRTVYNVLACFEETLNPHALPWGHPPLALGDNDLQYMLNMLQEQPTLYLDEIQSWLWDEHAVWVSLSTICQTLYHVGWSQKTVSKEAGQRNKYVCALWQNQNAGIPCHCFVWLDESGVDNWDHFWDGGWAEVGQAPIQVAPFGYNS